MNENLINDLLDLAKMDNCKFEIHKEYFSLVTAVERAFSVIHHCARQRGINLLGIVDTENDLDLLQSVLGDERRFMQILLNFLSNALKFTNKGGTVSVIFKILEKQNDHDNAQLKRMQSFVEEQVSKLSSAEEISKILSNESEHSELGLRPSADSEKFIHIQMVVRDSGIGIPNEDLKHLFMDFGKLGDKEGRNKGGTGLGLSICK